MADNTRVQVEIVAAVNDFVANMQRATGAFNEFTEGVTHKVELLKGAFELLIAAFAVEKIAELEEKFGSLAEQINRTAQMTGLSAEAVQQFNFAVVMSGGNVETATVTLERLEKNMAEAASGTGRAAELFQSLGISVKDTEGKMRPVDAILGDLAEKFSHSQDGATKTAYAMELMGRGGANLIPVLNKGREGLAELNKEFQETGAKLTVEQIEKFKEYEDSVHNLSESWKGFKLAVADFFEPAANFVVGVLTGMAQEITEVVNGIHSLTSALMNMPKWDGFWTTDDSEGKKAAGAAGSGKSALPAVPEQGATDKANKLAELAIERQRMLAEEGIKLEQQRDKRVLALDKATNAEYLQRQLDLQRDLDILDMRAAVAKQAAIKNDAVAYEKAGNDIIALKQKQALQEEAIQDEITKEAQKDYLKLGESINGSLIDSFASVIDSTKSMKEAFTDFAKSVLSDIAKIAAKNLALSLFGGGMGTSGLGGGLGGAFAGLVSSASSTGATAGTTGMFGGFFADGGDVSFGKGYVVGENGPEFFMPRSAGTIMNSSQLEAMGAGKSSNVNTSIVVNVSSSGSAESSVQSKEMIGKQLGQQLTGVVNSVIIQQMRPGGLLGKVPA